MTIYQLFSPISRMSIIMFFTPRLRYYCFCLLLSLIGLSFSSQLIFAQDLRLDLESAIRIAQEHSPKINAATQQKVQKKGLLTQARSGYLPHLLVGAEIGRQHTDELQPVDEATVGNASVSLSQLIYDFGETDGAIGTASNTLDAAEENLQQVRKSIAFACKKGFYAVLAQKQLIAVQDEAVKNYEQQLHRAKKYFDAGIRTKIDVTNASVKLSDARLALLQAKSNYKIARLHFEQILGIKPNHGNYILESNAGNLEDLSVNKPDVPESIDTLLETAFTSRSDLNAIDSLVQAASAEVRQARSGYFPSLKAQARFDEYDTDIESLQDQWSFGLRLDWELFSGLQTKGKSVTAKARYCELNSTRKEMELAVTREVTDSWLRGIEYRDSVDIAYETMQLATENFELADKRYKAGLNDMIEYNDAQLNLTRSQSNLVLTYYEYLTSLANLEYAIGVIPELQTETETETQAD